MPFNKGNQQIEDWIPFSQDIKWFFLMEIEEGWVYELDKISAVKKCIKIPENITKKELFPKI